MKLLFLPTVIILGWVLNHNIKKNKNRDKESVDSYLKRENAANFTRKQDISSLPYIQIPMDELPFDITLNDSKMQSKIDDYKEIIKNLSDKPMLNLIGVSNTELKEKYGPANLEKLMIYDQHYSRYIQTLSMYAQCIYEEYPKEAVKLCEYCLEIGTDIAVSYTLLGKHYLENGNQPAFDMLYTKIPETTSIAGKVIKNKLDALRAE